MLDGVHHPNYTPRFRPQQPLRPKRSRFRLLAVIVMFLLLAGGIFVGSKLVTFAQKIFEGQKFSFTRLFTTGDELTGEAGGEIKILLLGIPGGSHDGATLADTMILATLKPSPKRSGDTEVSLFSIPRDLAVEVPGFDIKKINSAYAYGEAEGKHNGPDLARRTVEKFLATEIPYYAVIDFQGFRQVIDHLGGVAVTVETSFTDRQFPNDQGGYLEALVFTAGPQLMDGNTALQFVRSRHGDNGQGSDFARSRRQQLLLKAVKDRVLRLQVFANFKLVDQLLTDVADHFRTNLAPSELKRLYDLAKNIEPENILSLSLDGEGGLLCDYIAPEDGAFLLVPCAGLGEFGAIRELWKNQFMEGRIAAENPKIEIQNAAAGEALASYTASLLALPHLKLGIGNFTGDAVYVQSVIYDNTGGQKPYTLSYLQDKLKIKTASSPFPFQTLNPAGADFVIIVTADIKR